MPNQTVKTGLKAQKIKMPQMIFFLKISNTTSMYLLAQSRVMRMCHFRVQNDPFVLNKIFLVQTIITFIYLLALFIVQNLKTFLLRPRVMRICHFRTQNSQLTPPKNIFLVQPIIITFIYLLALSIVQNLKFLHWIQGYEDAPILGPKWSICPKQVFLENY